MYRYLSHINGMDYEVCDGDKVLKLGVSDCLQDCLGVAVDYAQEGFSYIAVALHDSKAAKLFDHVFECSSYDGMLNVGQIYDFVILSGRHDLVGTGQSNAVIIDTADFDIKIMGYHGSVVKVTNRSGNFTSIYTLYDLFKFLYRETGIFIAKYDTIGIFSELGGSKGLIRFKCGPASRTYRSKMCVDISRG